MMRMSAILALVAAAALGLVKALLAERLWWPFLVVEYLAAAALAFGAIAALRGGRGRMLAAGWAFTLGITWSSFFHHLTERTSFDQLTLVDLGLGLLLPTAILGVGLCVGAQRDLSCPLPRPPLQRHSET